MKATRIKPSNWNKPEAPPEKGKFDTPRRMRFIKNNPGATPQQPRHLAGCGWGSPWYVRDETDPWQDNAVRCLEDRFDTYSDN